MAYINDKKIAETRNASSIIKGTINWFSVKKGYGFIQARGKDYFVHRWDIEVNSELEKGDKVSFESEKTLKGWKAIKVRKIS